MDTQPAYRLPRAATPDNPLRVGILLSGGGRTMTNLAQQIKRQGVPARIVHAISSRPNVAGLDRARELGIEPTVIDRKRHQAPAEFSDLVWRQLRQADAELICLAGFLSLLEIPDDQLGRVINIHPALLPSFGGPGMYGRKVHRAVLSHGCKLSGCTVHFCDNTYDTGPILVQRACPVEPTDTADELAARVFEQECIAYPQAVDALSRGRVMMQNRIARISQE